MLNRVKNLSATFHLLIIAVFVLSLSGCGYKAPPFYSDGEPIGDKNVKFIKKQSSE